MRPLGVVLCVGFSPPTFQLSAAQAAGFGSVNLSYLLTRREKAVIVTLNKEYRRRFRGNPHLNPNLVYHLGDNAQRKCWSAVSGKIPTLRRSGGITWSVSLRRPMTGREKLLSLGFPVSPQTAQNMNVPELPALDVKRCSMIAGNAMAWPSVGLVQLVALTSFALVA